MGKNPKSEKLPFFEKFTLSVILTVTMLVTMLPSAVFAVESDGKYEAESVEEADAASGQKADQEASVDEAGEKEAKNEEVQNEVDSELKDDGSDEARKAQDPAAEETGNTEEADKAEASEGKNVTSLVKEEKDYVVTVTYGDDAEVPPYAKIRVEEVKAKDDPDLYDSYVAQAAEAVKTEVEDLSYVKLLDISIVDENDKEVDLQGNVDVQIRLKDVEEAEDTTQVVHFAGEEEEPEVMDTEVDGDTVAFATEGFSVYAVVNTNRMYKRLVVEFYKKAYGSSNNSLFKTMYVKEADLSDDAEFKKIIYDPGVPTDAENSGKDFYWIDEDSAKTLTQPDPSKGKKIAKIREEITTLLTRESGIDDGTTIRYYPVFYKTFRLYYKDENGEVSDTVASYLAEGDTCTVDITKEYTAKKEGKVFRYWVQENADAADTKKYKMDGDGYEHTIALTDEATLVPVLADGYMVTFNENDGDIPDGASYTASQPRAFGEFPLEPAIPPTWEHHDFLGWFVKPKAEEGEELEPYADWAQDEKNLTVSKNPDAVAPTGNLTLYAHWAPKTSGPVDYTVKVYLENVDPSKEPVCAGQFVVKNGVEIGGKISDEALNALKTDSRVEALTKAPDLPDSSHGFDYKKTEVVYDGEDKKAGLLGGTVVNIYFDRAEMTVSLIKTFTTTEPELGCYRYNYDHEVVNYYDFGLKAKEKPTDNYDFYYVNANGEKQYFRKNANGTWKHYHITATGREDDDPAPTLYKAEETEIIASGKYGRPIQWKYGTASGKAPYKHSELAATPPSAYLTVVSNRCIYSFNGTDFKDNNAFVFQQHTDINTIIYIYNESEEAAGKFDFIGDTYMAAYRYSLPVNIGGWNEGFAPSEYAYVYVGNYKTAPKYSENVNSEKFNPPTGKEITLPESTDLEELNGGTTHGISKGWHPVDSTGIIGYPNHENFMYYLLIKNKRIEKKLVFKYKDDDGNWQDLYPDPNASDNKNISVKYGYTLDRYLDKIKPSESELKNAVEEKITGKVFKGWYLDPDCTKPANVATNLAEVTVGSADIPLYAKTVTGKYHVRVHWNDAADKDDNTETVIDFRVENEELLDVTNFDSFLTQRTAYSLIGYYKKYDAANDTYSDKWDFSTPVRNKNISFPYEGTEDAKRVTYADSTEPYKHNTIGVLELYANWYDESGGFKVKYVNPADAPEFEKEDSLRYKPGATVSLLDAPEKSYWPSGKRFDGWVLTNDIVYAPGDTFEAVADVAEGDKQEITDNGGVKRYIRYITVTARYVNEDVKTPTHIKWFNNYEKEGVNSVFKEQSGMDINEAVKIPGLDENDKVSELPERPGYKFLGWAKAAENETGLLENAASNLYITYNEDDNTYNYKYVAADEKKTNGTYDAFYAVWERATFKIIHSSLSENDPGRTETIDIPLTESLDEDTYDIMAKVKKGCMYGGYYDYDEDSKKWSFEERGPGNAIKPAVDDTNYLKEVDPNYLKPQLYVAYSKYTGVLGKMYGLVNVDAVDDYTSCGLLVRKSGDNAFKDLNF